MGCGGERWWRCTCGDLHQGPPRWAGALTGAGLVMHAPVPTQAATSPAPPTPGVSDDMILGAAVGWRLLHEEIHGGKGRICSAHQPIEAAAQRPRLIAALLAATPPTDPAGTTPGVSE